MIYRTVALATLFISSFRRGIRFLTKKEPNETSLTSTKGLLYTKAREHVKRVSDLASQSTSRQLPLSFLMFLLGGCGLAYEYTLSKIASDLLGNSVQQWAMMIATMLFAMGLGADFQKKIKEEEVSDTLVQSQNILALLGGCGPILLVYCFSQLPDFYILIQYGLALIVGTLIGFEIPLIMRLNESDTPEMRFNLAQVLKMDYIGALIGALLWTFFLIRIFAIEQISFVLGLTTLLASITSLFLFRKRIKKLAFRIGEILFILTVLTLGLLNSDKLATHAEQFLYRDKVVFSETTPYQHIVLTKSKNSNLRCYINGHLQFDERDEYIYHEHLVHPIMTLAPNAQRILILGGGDGLAIREVLKYPNIETVTLVDIDPMMTDLAQTHPSFIYLNKGSLSEPQVSRIEAGGVSSNGSFILNERNRKRPVQDQWHEVAELQIVNLDAASFVKNIENNYDLIIIDFPDPSSPDLAKLYSRPFYESLKHCLAPKGLIVQQSGSPAHAKEAYLCVGRTMRASGFSTLPFHDNVPSFGEWGWWLASLDSELTQEAAIEKFQTSAPLPETQYLTKETMIASLFFGKNLLHTEEQKITSLTRSSIYHYYLQGWKDQ